MCIIIKTDTFKKQEILYLFQNLRFISFAIHFISLLINHSFDNVIDFIDSANKYEV